MKNNLFGTDGIRTKAGEFPLDETSLLKLGNIIGGLTANAKIIVGRDTRASSPEIEDTLTRGLAEHTSVYSAGIIPTPGLAYLTRKLRFDFGIMISASHNPYPDNGIKIFNHRGEKIPDRLEKSISAEFHRCSKTRARKTPVSRFEESPDYPDFLFANGRNVGQGKIKIVLDCANGAASVIAPALFQRLGLPTCVAHARPDGKNISAGCGTTCPQELQALVGRERADLGIALDGDGDRVIFADQYGQILDGDHALYFLAGYLRRSEALFQKKVVGTVLSNLGLEKALTAAGMEFFRSAVGDKHVYRQMRKTGAILGGEPSGHLILRHLQTTGDGLLTALFFLQALDYFRLSAAAVRRQLRLFPQQMVSFPIRVRKDLQRWKALVQAGKQFREKHGSQARLLIRYSGTEPKIRVMIEARDMDIIQKNMPIFKELIQNEIGV